MSAFSKAAERLKKEKEKLERKLREEKERAERELREKQERLAREQREAQKKLEIELKEKQEKLEREQREAQEKLKREAEEAVAAAAATLKKQTEDIAKEQIKNAVESLTSETTSMTAEAQKFVKQIQNQLQDLMDLANIEAAKRKLLDKAEELSEEYLSTKVKPLAEQLQLAGIPDIKLDLVNTEIKMDLFIYFLLLDDKDKEPSQNAIGTLSTHLEQSITKLEVPDVNVKFAFNEGNINNIIKEKIESEKDQLIKAFLMQFFSDYVAVFDVIMKYLK
ncbi:hypothetical protein COK59_16090 [Bacillus thuringiensis]|uniref:hypothetical protein n=1 Tax=Bacillus thuringiensis TaxID=1428 RepID=UPI000BEB2B76|nr:hypothetical protein [Bacillus thuringiensis]PEC70915.1 hypothetical protein CON25_25455 [Bacillus thuringiensis]PFT07486.1 hypothetical protein COK59_16090 [Bacillus thuringiensis]PFU58165.1 hypothetical protein COK85_17875 [Bacillus thuringiensis]